MTLCAQDMFEFVHHPKFERLRGKRFKDYPNIVVISHFTLDTHTTEYWSSCYAPQSKHLYIESLQNFIEILLLYSYMSEKGKGCHLYGDLTSCSVLNIVSRWTSLRSRISAVNI